MGIEKDFSVDIHGVGFIPYTNENEINSQIDILVECKQRRESVKWLFLPDPNRGDLSSFTLGVTINAIDNFSMKFFDPNATVDFDLNSHLCFKGIEIDINDSRVYDSEIRHGLHQLQYALPRILKNNIMSILYSHEEDIIPFFMCPILLTTAQLFVAKKNFNNQMVEESSKIEDFSTEVPYLITYLDYGSDFKNHCIKEFEDLKKINLSNNNVKNISNHRKNQGEYEFLLPENLAYNLLNGNSLSSYFTQFIVCNENSFPDLIKNIKHLTSKETRKLKLYKRNT